MSDKEQDADDIKEILNDVRGLVNRIGDEVEEDFEGRVNEYPLYGFSCLHGNHTYLVMGSEAWEWIQIRYPISVDQMYAVRRLDMGETGDDEFTITSAQIKQARREFDNRLEDIREEDRREFRINLIQMLSREGAIVNLDTTNPLNIHGVNLDKKSFALDSEHPLKEFSQDVQTVINLGWVAKEFIAENYGFRPRPNSDGSFGPGV